MVKEARVVCGKARTCKLSGGKVIDVYDEDKKVYVPYEEFLRQQEEYKTNPIVDDTLDKKDEKKEYFTTHGKKTKETKLDKKPEVQNLPSNTHSTSNINLSTSGASGIDISVPDAPEINVGIEIKKDKEKIEDADPYDWYLKRILRRT